MTNGRAPTLLLAAGLLAGVLSYGGPSPLDAQVGVRPPLVEGGALPAGVRPPARLPADGRAVGRLPLDPEARGIGPRDRFPRRPFHHRRRLLKRSSFVLPVFGVGLHTTVRPPTPDADTAAADPSGRGADDADGGAPAAPDARPGERAGPEGDARRRSEGERCLDLAVSMEGGAVHRIRVDPAELDAATPEEAERRLRDRAASRGAVVVRGLDGASLHLDADAVLDVRAEPCRAVRVP